MIKRGSPLVITHSFASTKGFVVIFLALFALNASFTLAQQDLTVSITPDREVYGFGDPVNVTYVVTNRGETIHIERPDCTPMFQLIVFDPDGNEVWDSEDCLSCCCTCCQCPIHILRRDITPGKNIFPDDTTWDQQRTLGHTRCGCVTGIGEPPASFFLVGQVLDTQSDPVLVTIQ